MIELVFVIVVLGILASVAIPKFAATRSDAHIAKGRSDVSSIRSAIISERQSRLFRGNPVFIATLDDGGNALFGGLPALNPPQILLQYPIAAGVGNGKWQTDGDGLGYTFTILGAANTFTYCPDIASACGTPGTFDCVDDATAPSCGLLTD